MQSLHFLKKVADQLCFAIGCTNQVVYVAHEDTDTLDSLLAALSALKPVSASDTPNESGWCRFLPAGFRSGSLLLSALFFVGYALLLFLCLNIQVTDATPLRLIVNRIGATIAFFSCVLFTGNYLNVQSKFFLTRRFFPQIPKYAYRFISATTSKTESTQFIGHKMQYTDVIQTTGGQSVWQRRSGLHLQAFRNGSRPRSSAGSIYSSSGFPTALCAPLAAQRSITLFLIFLPGVTGMVEGARITHSTLWLVN